MKIANASQCSLILLMLMAFSSAWSADAPQLQEYACGINYSKYMPYTLDLEQIVPPGSSAELQNLKISLMNPNDGTGIAFISLINLEDQTTDSYICSVRSNYPNLREPPTTYSCASSTSQLMFDSNSGKIAIAELLSVVASNPFGFKFKSGRCSAL